MTYFHIEDPYSRIGQCAILYKELAKSTNYDELFKTLMYQYQYELTYDPDGVDAIRLEISLCLVKFLQKRYSDQELQLVLDEYPFLAYTPDNIIPFGITDNIMKAVIESSSAHSKENETSEDLPYYSISVLQSTTEDNISDLPTPCMNLCDAGSQPLPSHDDVGEGSVTAEDYEITSVLCPDADCASLYYSFEKTGMIPPLRIVGPTGVKVKHYLRSTKYHSDKGRLDIKTLSSTIKRLLLKYSYPCDYVFNKEEFPSLKSLLMVVPSTSKEKPVIAEKTVTPSRKRGKTKTTVASRKSKRVVQPDSPMNPEDDSLPSEDSI